MIKTYLFAVATFASLFAQNPTLSLTGPVSVRPGATVAVTLSTTAAAAVGYQWTLALPAGFTAAPTAGTATTSAAKDLVCNPAGTNCVVYGQTLGAIGAGALASYAVVIPATASGAAQFSLPSGLAASATATGIPVTLGQPYTLLVLARADLNGDGKIDLTDLQAMVNEVVTGGDCVDDQNQDGKCDVLDIILVLLKVLGQ